MRNLDMELLRTFVAIAEFSSFAAAADRVHRTQSAVTQQMQRLESQLGFTLFQKAGRTKQLTTQGAKLLEYAVRILALNDEAISMLDMDDVTGSLRIGAPNDIAETILPSLLSRFAKIYPQLRMEIHVGRSPFLMQALRRGEIDLTVSTRKTDAHPGIILRTSPTVWLCSSDYIHNPANPVKLVVADEPSLFREIALQSLDQAKIPYRISYVAPTLVGIKAALRAGLGITARSIEMISPELRVLGAAEGFPRLPDVNFFLYLRDEQVGTIARMVFDTLSKGTHDHVRGLSSQ
ncbi:LysR substrate-binding domain-containing protein [Glaciimonas sp. PAMC28666]|uniref:LysR substrate-binding domain-containing protein n=1 Tax=Glaciimonas sp. PAMC28666 TaxID=2807626 RepID=UPI0019633C11|nr:LysR substrate-binding domain-containing protein [Glaciimonas sp. PAMC28666]QRX81477.1 LysR family transcriptional regulator [Glaciimonas sp. PAMC28666]